MSPARVSRLLGLVLIVGGLIGVLAVVTGYFPAPPRDSTAAFPAAVALGIAVLHANRPTRSARGVA